MYWKHNTYIVCIQSFTLRVALEQIYSKCARSTRVYGRKKKKCPARAEVGRE